MPPTVGFGQPPPPANRTSGFAIGALVTGIVGIFTCFVVLVPLAAIVLGVLGLRQIKADPGRVQGRGLAISGIILGAIGLVIGVGWIALLVIDDGSTSRSDSFFEEVVSVPADDFAVGTCAQQPEDAEYGDLTSLPCTGPHGSELYFRSDVDPSITSYPGDAAMFDEAEAICDGAFEPYVGVSYDESSLGVYYFTPNKGSWSVGDREVVCFVVALEGEEMPTGSVAGTGI